MKIKFGLAACTAIALSMPAAAFAAGGANALSYNYLGGQLGYASLDPDGRSNNNGLGFGIDGSAALLPNLNLVGSYNHGFISGSDLNLLSLGAGLHTLLTQDSNFRLDAFGTLTYEHIDIGGSDDGIGIRGGLRAMFQPNLEVNGSVGYVDYGSEDGPVFKFGGVYTLPSNPNMALTLSYEHQDFDHFDVDQVLAGVRLYIN